VVRLCKLVVGYAMQHNHNIIFNASAPCSETAWHLQGSCQAVRQAVQGAKALPSQAPTCAQALQ
jgi:hypothetical protein